MKKFLASLQKLENAIVIITFSVMVAAAFAQVLNRNVFKFGIGWFEEMAVYCMIWMTLLGAESGLRDGSQMAITAVAEALKGKARAWLRVITKTLVVVFTAIIGWNALGMVLKQMKTGQVTSALHLPMWVPYSALLVCFGIMTVVQTVALVGLIQVASSQQAVRRQTSVTETGGAT